MVEAHSSSEDAPNPSAPEQRVWGESHGAAAPHGVKQDCSALPWLGLPRESDGKFQYGMYRKEADDLHSLVSYLYWKYDVAALVGHNKYGFNHSYGIRSWQLMNTNHFIL
ncbi:uncharacterized protein LOC112873783 isoform X1 [Panicum hallii]|uniref:uncharacterized protein LOC112873783 isoform X1 n=1 Tax=Panicum hallii TaxID=206008 RepID=UPI000DF4E7DD|nr:uncharacterized protein LOC112873783 isoform X1 [Panicum hallii]